MRNRHESRLAPAILALAVFFPVSAAAQGESGTIAGTVKDATGGVLPGTTVEAASPALIERVRSVTSDADGRFQIVNLRPGVYTVTFELPGFNTVVREGISLAAGFTASVNADLRVGAVEETITVTGEAPTVDVKNVVQLKTMSRTIIDSIPTAKTFGSLAALIPGVTVSRPDVGGSSGDLSTSLTIHGSRTSDSQIMMDGMSVGNGLGAGSYGHFFNQGMVQEISVETGGMAAEHDAAGVRSNLIPREGGNNFAGTFAGAYTNRHFNSSTVSDELLAQGLQTNSVNEIYDFNPSAGGRLVRDKLWFYLSFREWGTSTTRAGSAAAYPNATRQHRFYTPDLTRRALDHTWHRSASNRFTWQASPRNKVTATYEYQDHEYEFPTDAVGSAPEARSFYRETPQYLAQVTWSSPLTNRFLLEAGGTLAANDFIRLTQPEVVPGVSPITELSTNFSYRANPAAPYGHNRSSNYNYRVSSSYITGAHTLQDRCLPPEHLVVGHERTEQSRQSLGAQRHSGLARAVGDADQLLREDQVQHRPLRPGPVDLQSRDHQSRGPRRLLQRLRRAAVAPGGRLRAGARLPRRLRRSELAGSVAAARGVVRRVRRRQDRHQGQPRPLPAGIRHPEFHAPRQSDVDDGQQRLADVDRSQRQLRCRTAI